MWGGVDHLGLRTRGEGRGGEGRGKGNGFYRFLSYSVCFGN